MKLKTAETRPIDLKGHTLLPGFIDAHGHMINAGKNLIDANLFNASSVADVQARMVAHAATVPEGEWIVGLRPDQIVKMKEYGGVPSYLTSSLVSGGPGALYLWGEERGNKVMAAATLAAAGMPFTFSHDAPISPEPWIMPLVDAGVNRTLKDGRVVGADERVPPYLALKAVTAYAAWEIKEDTAKGTLEPGKLADLVILEANPLKVDPKTIKDIAVLETIKEGTTVFARK